MFDTTRLAQFQQSFLAAIMSRDDAVPAGLQVYRDTWRFGLLDVLKSRYEACAMALGEEAFKAFGRDYVHAFPLATPDCSGYGDRLPEFLRQHRAAQDFDWIVDLAAYEKAIDLAHHAADAAPCGFEDLLSADIRCDLHPSVQVAAFQRDVRAFHGAVLRDEVTDAPPLCPLTLLIGRDRADSVISAELTPYEAQFLQLIGERHSLMEALDRLTPDTDQLSQLQTLLARMVAQGLFITL